MHIRLATLDDTYRLGAVLAQAIQAQMPENILLYGDLGAGKTTLTRALVEHLPTQNPIDISSPSFTILNIYSTFPTVHHFDLYRLEDGTADDSLLESFDCSHILTIVEWAERIDSAELPLDGLQVRFSLTSAGERMIFFHALGLNGQNCLTQLHVLWQSAID